MVHSQERPADAATGCAARRDDLARRPGSRLIALLAVASCAPTATHAPVPPVPQPAPVAAPRPVPIAAPQPPPDPLAAQVDARFHDLDRTDGPGCSVAVSRRGTTLLARGYGMANLEHGIRNTPSTAFYIASVAKQVTGLVVALLIHDGALAASDDVRTYIPELPAYEAPVRVEQLLHHTSGIRDFYLLAAYAGVRGGDLLTTDDALARIARQHELNFAPGTSFSYSNSNYFLLSRIVEKVTGKPLRDVAAERIFGPLGMTHSRFRADHADLIPGRATGYVQTARGLRIADTTSDVVGQGGLYASAEDLLRWATQLAGAPLGGPDVLRAQVSSGKLANGDDTGYGYGLFVGPVLGRPAFEHSGGVAGYRADLVVFPATQLAVVVLCNTDVDAPELAHGVAQIYLGDPAPPAEAPAAPAPAAVAPAPAPAAAPVEDLRPYAGVFWSRELGAVSPIEVDAGALRVVNPEGAPVVLRALGGGRFRATTAPITFTFQPPRAGRSPGLTRQRDGKPATPWERAAPADVTRARLARYAGEFRNDDLDVTWRFVVTGDHVVLRRPRQPDATLIPVFLDAFVDEPGGDLLRFEGRRWTVTSERIRGLAFTRSR